MSLEGFASHIDKRRQSDTETRSKTVSQEDYLETHVFKPLLAPNWLARHAQKACCSSSKRKFE